VEFVATIGQFYLVEWDQIYYLARDYDQFCFPFSTKGFFGFKEQIPKILSKIL